MSATTTKPVEHFLICQSEANKFWSVSHDESTHTVVVRWGRIGTAGQSQTKRFTNGWDASSFVSKKLSEKRSKDYRATTKEKLEQLHVEASIVGTSNKCHGIQWVEEEASVLRPVDELRLAQPDCDPKLHVKLETRKEYCGQHEHELLFCQDAVFSLPRKSTTLGRVPITNTHPLYELVKKVEEAVGRSLA